MELIQLIERTMFNVNGASTSVKEFHIHFVENVCSEIGTKTSDSISIGFSKMLLCLHQNSSHRWYDHELPLCMGFVDFSRHTIFVVSFRFKLCRCKLGTGANCYYIHLFDHWSHWIVERKKTTSHCYILGFMRQYNDPSHILRVEIVLSTVNRS
eukprot:75086_1